MKYSRFNFIQKLPIRCRQLLIFSVCLFLINFFFISSICDEFEEMSMNAGERPKKTAEVVALQNYLSECKEERIVKLKDEIKKAAERVIFLLYHAQLDGKTLFKSHYLVVNELYL